MIVLCRSIGLDEYRNRAGKTGLNFSIAMAYMGIL